MEIYQLLLRDLDGRTRCLNFTSRAVSCDDVASSLSVCERIPKRFMRLVTGTRELVSGSVLEAGIDGFFPSCTLLLRLRGGKGGFGSLLRGAATKAGQKKTSNFDACRDMSGRRLRHVNAEKKLKEWKADAKERELEKTAEDFLKKQKKTEEEDKGLQKELQKFRKESIQAREDIGSAVVDGLVEAAKLGVDLKRKKVEAVEFEVKKARTWSADDFDEEDEEDDVDEEEESGPSSADVTEAGASTSNTVEASASCSTENEDSLTNFKENTELLTGSDEQAGSEDTVQQPRSLEAIDSVPVYVEVSRSSPDSSIRGGDVDVAVDEQTTSSGNPCGDGTEASPGPSSKATDTTPLDFNNYNTSKQLEVLGLERLKTELQTRGLKCGGSLSERAARLFLLKTTAIENLDKSVFTKSSGKAARK